MGYYDQQWGIMFTADPMPGIGGRTQSLSVEDMVYDEQNCQSFEEQTYLR